MKKILYRNLINENLNVEIDVPDYIKENYGTSEKHFHQGDKDRTGRKGLFGKLPYIAVKKDGSFDVFLTYSMREAIQKAITDKDGDRKQERDTLIAVYKWEDADNIVKAINGVDYDEVAEKVRTLRDREDIGQEQKAKDWKKSFGKDFDPERTPYTHKEYADRISNVDEPGRETRDDYDPENELEESDGGKPKNLEDLVAYIKKEDNGILATGADEVKIRGDKVVIKYKCEERSEEDDSDLQDAEERIQQAIDDGIFKLANANSVEDAFERGAGKIQWDSSYGEGEEYSYRTYSIEVIPC